MNIFKHVLSILLGCLVATIIMTVKSPELSAYSPTEKILKFDLTQNSITESTMPGSSDTFSDLPYYAGSAVSTFNIDEVIGGDDRRPLDTKNQIVHINVKWSVKEEDYGEGTGIMIAPNVILTAAHNVYGGKDFNSDNFSDNKGIAEWIRVIPGAYKSQNGDLFKPGPAGIISPKIYYINTRWMDSGDRRYDYAIIELPTQAGNITGYFGVKHYDDNWKDETAIVAGYPKEVTGQTSGIFDQWYMEGKIISDNDGLLKYEMDTSVRQSGGPVYLTESSGSMKLIGVHSCYNEGYRYNQAVRINKNLFYWIKSYR